MSGELNGVASPIKIANPIADLLRVLLVEAEKGNINTFGAIIVSPQGAVQTPFGGGRLLDLFGGAGLLQLRVRDQMEQPKSGLIRPIPG